MKKILKISIMLTFVLLLVGCEQGLDDVHTREQLIKEIDKLKCTSKSGLCDLKGKYTIVNEEYNELEDGKKERILYAKLNDYDITFTITSYFYRWNCLDGSCASSGYITKSSYYQDVFKYYYDNFNKTHNSLCEIRDYGLTCNVGSKNDIVNISNYFSQFIDYLNENKGLYFANDYEVLRMYIYIPQYSNAATGNSSYIYLYIYGDKNQNYELRTKDTVVIYNRDGEMVLYCSKNTYDKLDNEDKYICKTDTEIDLFEYLTKINDRYDLVD